MTRTRSDFMNAVRNAGCTIIAAVLLVGCASMREQAAVASSKEATQPAPYAVDSSYVNKVERAARKDNVDVQWVNPPTNRATSGGPR
jgi:PBP1b-binding outer membrane lipoprotein LpoB